MLTVLTVYGAMLATAFITALACAIHDNRRLARWERGKEWSGHPDPADPDNYWIDDETGKRIPAADNNDPR